MVLVTGGTGFLGAYIIKHLVDNEYAVRAIKRASSKIPFFLPPHIAAKVEWIDADILDITELNKAMQGAQTIIHAAAKISFDKAERQSMYETNIDGTANVVNLALENNIERVVYISSIAALGRTKSGEKVDEKKEWAASSTNTHYAISKHKAEMEVWRAIAEGLNGVILNPSTILGFGDWNASSSAIFKNVYNEFPFYTEGINGFVDVEDVAKAAVLLMESDISAQRFVVSGDNYSFKQVFDLVAAGFGKKKPTRVATQLLGQVAWRVLAVKAFFTQKKPLLTRETAKIAQSKTYFDNTKILKALPGFQFKTLEVTIQQSCARYLSFLQGKPTQ